MSSHAPEPGRQLPEDDEMKRVMRTVDLLLLNAPEKAPGATLNSTQLNSTHFNSTHVNSTQLNAPGRPGTTAATPVPVMSGLATVRPGSAPLPAVRLGPMHHLRPLPPPPPPPLPPPLPQQQHHRQQQQGQQQQRQQQHLRHHHHHHQHVALWPSQHQQTHLSVLPPPPLPVHQHKVLSRKRDRVDQ